MHNQLAYKMKIHIKDCACIPNPLFVILKIISILSRRDFVPLIFRQSIQLLLSSKDETHLKSFMMTEKSFVDIGANVGVHTLSMAKKGVFVYAFEPSPNALETLYRLTKFFDNIEVFPYALGSKEGLVKVYLHDNSETDSMFFSTDYTGVCEVKMKTLDDFNLKNIGIIKIDTEGFELHVLKGAVKTLKREKPRLILEIHNPLFDNEANIKRFLMSLGYEKFRKIWKFPRYGQFHLIVNWS